MTSEHAVTVATLVQTLDEFNRHDLDAFMAFFTEDAKFDTPRGRTIGGIASSARQPCARGWRHASPVFPTSASPRTSTGSEAIGAPRSGS